MLGSLKLKTVRTGTYNICDTDADKIKWVSKKVNFKQPMTADIGQLIDSFYAYEFV